MASIDVGYSEHCLDLLKKYETGIGPNNHNTKDLHGQYPYGYVYSKHNWNDYGDAWKDKCAKNLCDDQETKWYIEGEGWQDEASEAMLNELVSGPLTVGIQKLANSNLNLKNSLELHECQWDSIASVAWDLGVPSIKNLFELLNTCTSEEQIKNKGAGWITEKRKVTSQSPNYQKYLEERGKCEAARWKGEIPTPQQISDYSDDPANEEAVAENAELMPDYTPEIDVDSTSVSKRVQSELKCHMAVVYSKDNAGKLHKENLFVSKIYYAQNDSDGGDGERELLSKSLLYLHTLPFNYASIKNKNAKSFFNDKDAKHGGKELVPYGVILFLGGLIWRRMWHSNNGGDDPIRYGNGNDEIYKKTESGYDPLLVSDGSGKFVFGVMPSSSSNTYNVKYEDVVNTDMDIYTANRLVDEFVSFSYKWFKEIMSACELKYKKVSLNTDIPTSSTGDLNYNPDQSVVDGVLPSQSEKLDFDKFSEIEKNIKNEDTLPGMLNVIMGAKPIEIGDGDDSELIKVSNFVGNYAMAFYNREETVVQAFFSDTNIVNMYFTELFKGTAIALTVGHNVDGKSVNGVFRRQYYEDYLKGFENVISVYAKKQEAALLSAAKALDTLASKRELNLALYMELKNIWDRWICGYYNSRIDSDRDYFRVMVQEETNKYQNTMYANFAFIDSFYLDISQRLRLNCDLLLKRFSDDMVETKDGGRNRVNVHLGGVASDHRCVMINFPDNIGFTDKAWEKPIEIMQTMFKPIPSSRVPLPNVMNKFVVIYANFAGMSETLANEDYNTDTFNIYSYKDGTSIAPAVFDNTDYKISEAPRMGYFVPSFCVEYSRQNNSYWTNLNVSMENNANTSQSVLAYSLIAEKGNSSKRQVCFYGQDIYPIYQAYSYFVTIEMLGDANIQPLMYFQLLNIPMFNGAYMVISVEHDIKPGAMKTIIKGVKMSRVRVPFTRKWFAVSESGMAVEGLKGSDAANNTEGDAITAVRSERIDIADNNLEEAIKAQIGKSVACDTFVKEVYGYSGINVSIENSLKASPENMYAEITRLSDEWDVHEFREPACKKNGWKPLWSGKEHPQCGDLLFGYHDGVTNTAGDYFHHVSIYLGYAASRSSEMFVAEGYSVGGKMFRDYPTTVQVCSVRDSKMGLGQDMITHWARCKKYKVKQVSDILNESFNDFRLVGSEVGEANMYEGGYDTQSMSNYDGKVYYTVDEFLSRQDDVNYINTNIDESGNVKIYSVKKDRDGNKFVDYNNVWFTTNIRQNLQNLLDNVLNPAVGCYLALSHPGLKKPHVSSGYRNQKRNEKTKGASITSQHCYGEAADLQFIDDKDANTNKNRNVELAKIIASQFNFDQLILEYPNSATDLRCKWIHVSYSTGSAKIGHGNNRRINVYYGGNNYPPLDYNTLMNFTPPD